MKETVYSAMGGESWEMRGQDPGTILCVNHWHDDNKGDSAITEGTLRLLQARWPQARIRVATLQEAGALQQLALRKIQRTFPEVEAEPSLVPTRLGSWLADAGERSSGLLSLAVAVLNAVSWFLRLAPFAWGFLTGTPPASVVGRLEGVDLMVMIGGSNIYDDPDVTAPLSMARLFTVLYPMWAARRLGIPTVLFGHTLGPFRRRAAARLVRRVLGGAERIYVREQRSLAEGRRLDLDVSLVPDVAFAVQPRHTERVARLLDALPAPASESLTLVVRQHPHKGPQADRRVLEELADLARAMLAAGEVRHVLVVAHAFGRTAIEDDREVSRQLGDLLPVGRTTLVELDLTPGELAALYGGSRLVVAVRLHAAILAMAGGTPAYAIGYFTTKTEGVMADAGLPCAWAPFEEVTAAMVRKELPLLLSPSTRAQLGERVAFARSALAGEVDGWQYQGSRLRPPSLLPVIPTPDTGDGGAADDAAPCVS